MAAEIQLKVAEGFTLGHPEQLEELYVDGVSGLIPGWPNSKLLLHSVFPRKPGDTNAAENRRAVLVVTMPTAVMIEMSQKLLSTFVGAKDQLEAAANIHLTKALEMIGSVEQKPAVGGATKRKSKD